MKKAAAAFILFLIAVLYTASAFCENGTKVSYSGNTYALISPVMPVGNEYSMDIEDLSRIIGFTYTIDKNANTLSIKFRQDTKTSEIKDNSLQHKAVTDAPVYIDNRLYLPFNFIEKTLVLTVKYNKESDMMYLLPSGQAASFKNVSYDYSLPLPEDMSMQSDNHDGSFKDDTVQFANADHSFSVDITCEKIDNSTVAKMREYLNDVSSSEREIFNKIIDLKESYFRALKDYYKKDFLFGSNDEKLKESNIKVFSEYDEEVFGQNSHIIMYNLIKSDSSSSTEDTHVNIFVPVYSNRTLYSINFTINKGMLDESTLSKMSSIIKSMRISYLPGQQSGLRLLSDKDAIGSANLGIYPDLSKIKITYTSLVDDKAGYKITYPSSFLPYRQNNIATSYDYNSFKINYNHFFSIAVEPVKSADTIENKISLIKQIYGDTMTITNNGNLELNGKNYNYIQYEVSADGYKTYLQDYFITNGNTVYDIQLNSRLVPPSKEILDEFLKILSSVEFIPRPFSTEQSNGSFSKYINREEGYTFSYPDSWKLLENETDINYDSLAIKSPDFSGPVDISVSEGELNSYLLYTEITKFLAATDSKDFSKYFLKYSAPYMDRVSKTLMTDYQAKDGAIYLTKLVNYVADDGRSKVCYSKDIIRGKKIYSLFISVSDYATIDQNMFGNDLKALFSKVVESFTVENTRETYLRFIAGEIRNRKVVFIEDYFQKNIDAHAKVTSVIKPAATGDLLVTLDAGELSGYYRVKMDFAKKEIHVLGKLLKKDALEAAIEKVKLDYRGRNIIELTPEPTSMAIGLKYRENSFSPVKNVIFEVKPDLTAANISWKLSKKFDYAILKNNCTGFLENMLNQKVKAYFPSERQLLNGNEGDQAYRSYLVPVFVQYSDKAGYYLLTADPAGNDISLVSYTPLESIYPMVKDSYSGVANEYAFAGQRMREDDPFIFDVFLVSYNQQSYRVQTVQVVVDQESRRLVIK